MSQTWVGATIQQGVKFLEMENGMKPNTDIVVGEEQRHLGEPMVKIRFEQGLRSKKNAVTSVTLIMPCDKSHRIVFLLYCIGIPLLDPF